jgi:hypothetical protein
MYVNYLFDIQHKKKGQLNYFVIVAVTMLRVRVRLTYLGHDSHIYSARQGCVVINL